MGKSLHIFKPTMWNMPKTGEFTTSIINYVSCFANRASNFQGKWELLHRLRWFRFESECQNQSTEIAKMRALKILTRTSKYIWNIRTYARLASITVMSAHFWDKGSAVGISVESTHHDVTIPKIAYSLYITGISEIR